MTIQHQQFITGQIQDQRLRPHQGFVKNHAVTITGLGKGKTVYYIVSSCNDDGLCRNSSQFGFIAGRDIIDPTFSDVSIEELNVAANKYYYNDDSH